MCFPAAYNEIGWVGGVLATLLIAALYQYTSLTLWEVCLRHPEVRDICDVGRLIMGSRPWAWWATAAMFVANNTVGILFALFLVFVIVYLFLLFVLFYCFYLFTF